MGAERQTKKNVEQNCTLSADEILRTSKASNNIVCCSHIMELRKFFRISYDQAMDIANSPGFPKAIFNDEEPFPKAEIAAWLEQRLALLNLKIIKP